MKLEILTSNHFLQAAASIDVHGTPKDKVWSQYYVVVDGREYPFKHIVQSALHLATKSILDSEPNEANRRYVEGLGFKINFYRGGFNFFTKEELNFYREVVETDYRADNPEHSEYGQKLYPIIAKAKYWAEQIMPPGFKLRQDGRWLTAYTSRVKPYFWPRVYSGEDKDIFFNVEVNGAHEGGFLGYKLDGYYETTRALPDYKIAILDQFKKSINWEWPKIYFDQIEEYNWERLIAESRAYVQKYLTYHDQLKRLLSKESKMARITWNTLGWVKPSGRDGKTTNASFEAEHGFGHEEWLFDGDKVIDGFKYGFLEPIHKQKSAYDGKIYDIALYTRHKDSSKSYWVTSLKDVEILAAEKAEEVLAHYKREGWYDLMKADLQNLNLDPNQLDEWTAGGAANLFNVRFAASQLHQNPSELIPVEDESEIPSTRYTLMDIPPQAQRKIDEVEKAGFSFQDSGSTTADMASSSSRSGQSKEIEVDLRHNRVQASFLKYLQVKYGRDHVRRECSAHGGARIDIVRKTASGYIFYEIKTYNSLRNSIREALGQLLEYSLYPDVLEAEGIVLVSDVPPSESDRKYLLHLKGFIKIPFSYVYFDLENEEVAIEI